MSNSTPTTDPGPPFSYRVDVPSGQQVNIKPTLGNDTRVTAVDYLGFPIYTGMVPLGGTAIGSSGNGTYILVSNRPLTLEVGL